MIAPSDASGVLVVFVDLELICDLQQNALHLPFLFAFIYAASLA
jgi:hypothetical protein